MIKERYIRGKYDGSWRSGNTPNDVFNWWMEHDILPGQINLFENEMEEE